MWTLPTLFSYTKEPGYSQRLSCEEHRNVQKVASILYWYFLFTTRSWNVCIFDPERCHGYRTTWMLLLAPHEGCCALCVVGMVGSSLATQQSGNSLGWISGTGGGMGMVWSHSYHSYKCLQGNAHSLSVSTLAHFCLNHSFPLWFD